MDSPTIADALDGLQCAEQYCEEHDMTEYVTELGRLYQAIARQSPDDEWDSVQEHPVPKDSEE